MRDRRKVRMTMAQVNKTSPQSDANSNSTSRHATNMDR